jgi:hypothetical protein
VGLAKTHGRRDFSVRLLGPLILGSFLYFSTLDLLFMFSFWFLQFFKNNDVASVNWMLQNITFTGGLDHRGSLKIKRSTAYSKEIIITKSHANEKIITIEKIAIICNYYNYEVY